MDPVISLQNVDHFYGTGELRKQVLFGVSTDIYPGEIVILTGPSGSGKTTLLTLAGGLRSVHHGSVRVLGQALKGAKPDALVRIREKIGFIFQAHNLLDSLTARQNVQMSLGLEPGLSNEQLREKALAMLAAVGMSHRVDYLPSQLSMGQKQRVAIARALVRQPKVILADEPTASLDRESGREVVDILQELAKAQGCAILLVTHDHRILDVADRILALEDGRITSFASGMAANMGHLLAAFAQFHRKGDLLRHIARLDAAHFVELLEQVTSEFDQFLTTVELGNQEAIRSLCDELLEAVILKMKDLLAADRGTLFIVDENRGKLISRVAQGEGGRSITIEIPMDLGIAGRVARTGAVLNISDPYRHPDFNPQVDRDTGYRTRNILCVPIPGRAEKILAVAQLLNKKGDEAFSAEDERALARLAAPLGVILESCVRMLRRAASLVEERQ
jgi:putative ABC transport system ATP-binding protein